MTTTEQRAHHLARAASLFPFLGETTAESLRALVACELGSAAALDDFVPRGDAFAQAIAPGVILHIVSGNTPAAGLQTLIRGLLLGAHNLCKIPSAGLPELVEFRRELPPELARQIEIAPELGDDWIARADALVVFGSDTTIAHFRSLARPGQLFLAHGHKLSFGVIFEEAGHGAVAAAARDVAAFDQQGCLSPHVFYTAGDAERFAARLSEEMRQIELRDPRGPISVPDSVAIRSAREELEFRAANGEPIIVWSSEGTTAWTVAFDATAGFPVTPMNRFITVKPLPADLTAELRPVRPHLSCAGIWPATLDHGRTVAATGVSRICPLGQMQMPPWTWHQDGLPTLASLVRWIDLELPRARH